LCVTQFLSFIKVIPVPTRRSSRPPPSPSPTFTPQNLFNFEIVFDFFLLFFAWPTYQFLMLFTHSFSLFLPLFTISLSLILSLLLTPSSLLCVWKKGMSDKLNKKKTKKKYNMRSTFVLIYPRFHHCEEGCCSSCTEHILQRFPNLYVI